MNAPLADELLDEMREAPRLGGVIAKISYTHQDMIDFILANPHISQGALAARYGFTQAWVCQVMQSDAWQVAFAKRREELVDPTLAITINERWRAVADLSLQRLLNKLEAPNVSDQTVLKAAELGAKAMGVGGNAPPPAPAADHLAQLANRLLDLQSNVRRGVTYEGEASPAS